MNIIIRHVVGDELMVFKAWAELVKSRNETQREALIAMMRTEVSRHD